jgi:hypothetical protein
VGTASMENTQFSTSASHELAAEYPGLANT